MAVPNPMPILRFIHVDNFPVYLERGGLHAPNTTPDNGLDYKTIHNLEIQQYRRVINIPCGQGQQPIIYLVTTVQWVLEGGAAFVFSDGHGIARFTEWFDNLDDLDKVDWDMVYQRYWADNVDDMDRQRRKQAEFLVHQFLPWSLIQEIAVIDAAMKQEVEKILKDCPAEMSRPVTVRKGWYY